MTNFYVNIDFQGQKNVNEKLLDVMDNIHDNDELIINIDTRNHRKFENVMRILDDNHFEYITKGNNDGNMLSIVARLRNS